MLKPSQRCLGMSSSDLNGLGEFVRDGGKHFSHRANPARMGKIGEELFGLFAVLNISPGNKQTLNLSPVHHATVSNVDEDRVDNHLPAHRVPIHALRRRQTIARSLSASSQSERGGPLVT